MGILSGLEPASVFGYFEEITRIPHGSADVKVISDYLVHFAEERHLEVRQDEALNVVIKKPASAGYDCDQTLMIQGHMDMVAVQDPGTSIDMTKDPLELEIKDGYVHAKGTSLGGDDGIAVAMALAILDDDTIEHPALEVVLTTGEEIGMLGADALDTSDLKAKYLLNLDSETEGELLAGCAGGAAVTAHFPVQTVQKVGTVIDITVEGLIGGHSGQDIDKQRANASVIMGRLLYELRKDSLYSLISINGGEKDNTITIRSDARILVDSNEYVEPIIDMIHAFEKKVKEEYRVTDPDLSIIARAGETGTFTALTDVLQEQICSTIFTMPYGVQSMSMDLPGLVESSLNLGILSTKNDEIEITWSVRSSIQSIKELLIDKITCIVETFGGTVTISGDYPAWPFNPGSKISGLCSRIYEKQTGKKAKIMSMHAGVECGLLLGKMPGLDIVSMGPTLLDIHTTREHMDIASVQRTWKLVLEVLKEFRTIC